MNWKRLLISLAAGLLALFVLSFFFDDKKLDTNDAAAKIEADLVPGTQVSCPGDVKIETGGKFECTGTATNGKDYPIEVTIISDKPEFTYGAPRQLRK